MTTITMTNQQLTYVRSLLRFIEMDSDDELIQYQLKIVYEAFKPTAEKPTAEQETWQEECVECDTLMGGKEFTDEKEFDEHPDRLEGYDDDGDWHCAKCREEPTCEACGVKESKECKADCSYQAKCIEEDNKQEEPAPKCIGANGSPCKHNADADLCECYDPSIDDYEKYWKQCKKCAYEECGEDSDEDEE